MKKIITFFCKMENENQFENFVITQILEAFKHMETENYESLRRYLSDARSFFFLFFLCRSSTRSRCYNLSAKWERILNFHIK